MEKKGILGIIALSALIVLVIGGGATGYYFYNYYVFKEFRVCVGGEEVRSPYPCSFKQDCLDLLDFADDAVQDAPEFIQDNFYAILDEVVYCNQTCVVKNIRGINYETGELEELDSCMEGEKEFVMEIRGKEGLEILEWLKKYEDKGEIVNN